MGFHICRAGYVGHSEPKKQEEKMKENVLDLPSMFGPTTMPRSELEWRLAKTYGINDAQIILAQIDLDPTILGRIVARLRGITNNSEWLSHPPGVEPIPRDEYKQMLIMDSGFDAISADILAAEPAPDIFSQIEKTKVERRGGPIKANDDDVLSLPEIDWR